MLKDFSRTEQLLGKKSIEILDKTTVTIFGLGGVGSFTAEALARCGVGKFILIDSDTVTESNINRQLIALNSTVGRYKVDIMTDRIMDINAEACVEVHKVFYLPGEKDTGLFNCNYVVDAIDTISSKLDIIEKAKSNNLPVISAMSAGNKLNPLLFEVSDIFSTSVCPICRVMRGELRKRKIKSLKVVYSKEQPILKEYISDGTTDCDKRIPSSVSFVPSVMGFIIASEVVKDILKL